MAHTMIAIESIHKGLGKLMLNEAAIERDLDAQWAVVAEGIQTILRRAGHPQPYELLKDLTRGKDKITQADIAAFIDKLDVSDTLRTQLKALTPRNYTGVDPDQQIERERQIVLLGREVVVEMLHEQDPH
jgi:adenylosuccinate lyase